MQSAQHVLISLEKRHAINILDGTKQVEFRRRIMHVDPGSIVWIYVKKPVGAVIGFATVGKTYSAAPSTVWRKYSAVSGLRKSEFMSYFDGAAKASVMAISNPQRLKNAVTLNALRAAMPGFQPPQFYCRIRAELLKALEFSMKKME